MTDYDTVLLRKIQETYDDPAKLREVVYEAARLALRWQVQEQGPRLGDLQSRRHLSELEDAIARVEAASSGPGATGKREPGKAAAGRPGDQFSQSEEVDYHDAVHGQQAQDSSAELYGLEAVARVLEKSNDCERSKTSAALHESPHSAVVPVEFEEDAGKEPHSQVGNLQQGRHGDVAALGGRGSRESRGATQGSPGSRQRRREEILEGAPDLADEARIGTDPGG
jgi:hypothetical protein